jgi:ribosomal protein S20
VAGAAVVVTASAAGVSFGSNKPAGTTNVAAADAKTQSSACAAFMKHFAEDIHKTQAEINAAFQKAISDTLADEVKSGQITQAQADAIKKKLAGQTPCTLPSTAPHGSGGDKARIGAYMQQYITAAAAALGISEAQLKTDLSSGQSLSQVAAARHVSEADFRTKLIANLKPVLDKAVTDKKLTADQEQKIIGALQTGPLPLWNTAEKHLKPTPPTTAATTT